MVITRNDNYFEDFEVGDEFQHARGKTVGEFENHLVTHMTMNTAEGHFNEHKMTTNDNPIGGARIVVGYLVLAIVVGLTSEDTTENAITDLGYDDITFDRPTRHEDTLYAESRVLEKYDPEDRDDAGVIVFEVTGKNQDDEQVCKAKRRVLIKKRTYWGED